MPAGCATALSSPDAPFVPDERFFFPPMLKAWKRLRRERMRGMGADGLTGVERLAAESAAVDLTESRV